MDALDGITAFRATGRSQQTNVVATVRTFRRRRGFVPWTASRYAGGWSALLGRTLVTFIFVCIVQMPGISRVIALEAIRPRLENLALLYSRVKEGG